MVMSDSNEKPYRALYRRTKLDGYKDAAHIFALDYYRPGSQGEDDFSRKEAWFYYLGDKLLEEEFGESLEKILDDLFVDNTVDWDIITLAPSSGREGLNQNMLGICRSVSEKLGIEYQQVLRRTREVEDSGEFQDSRRILEMQSSMEVEGDVEGMNIILLDNVSIHGSKLSYLTEILLDTGAKRVFCVCLGVTNHVREVQDLDEGVTASAAVKAFGGEDEG